MFETKIYFPIDDSVVQTPFNSAESHQGYHSRCTMLTVQNESFDSHKTKKIALLNLIPDDLLMFFFPHKSNVFLWKETYTEKLTLVSYTFSYYLDLIYYLCVSPVLGSE